MSDAHTTSRQPVTSRVAAAVERRPLTAALVVSVVVALAVVSPFWFLGNASGHDFEFHLYSWLDAAHSWRAGVLFPRWAELANYKYGEPRFIFYPPLSWMLGAALSFLLPWKMVAGAFVVLALTVAGVSMFRLAREYLPLPDAVMAGALYLANPYHLVVVYIRSAYAELLVSALFPLAVLYVLRLPRECWRAVGPLALVFGAIWLTNAPAALMTSYALALLLVVLAWAERSPALLLPGAAALGTGLMLAAVYIVPATAEQSWVRIHEILSAGLTPDENFLFAHTPDRLHDAFNAAVSTVAVIEIGVLALIILIALVARTVNVRERLGKAWPALIALGEFSSLLMVRMTAPLWRVLPKLRFIQFPWRWLVVLSFCVALLVAASLAPKPRLRIAGWLCVAVLLGFDAHYFVVHGWWDPDGADTVRSEALDIGYDGSDEYAPVATDHYDLVKELPAASLVDDDGRLSDAHALVREWLPEERRLEVETHAPAHLMLRLVSYPAWQVKVNEHLVETATREGTGEIVVPIAAGKSEVYVRFVRTKDRVVGGIVSVAGLLLIVLVSVLARPRPAD